MAQPTPGPWDYVPGNEHHGPYVTTDYGSTVCDCYMMSRPGLLSRGEPRPVGFMSEMAEPNARLIATAPDMLAALKGLVENPAFELGAPKVSGRAGGEKRDAAMSAWDGFVEAARSAIAKAEGR